MICTFYSYKGGVGRSMALANVAHLLAFRGLRVLMIDFDLEAPGLEKFFPIDTASVHRHRGLLDLLLDYKRSMSVSRGSAGDEPLFKRVRENFVLPVYAELPSGGRLDLLPAGRRDGEHLSRYAFELRTFDWQDFYFNWEGELFFEWLRRELVGSADGGPYDVVLVDSRTGVTEMGGICAYQLADALVMLCAANHQNVEGTLLMARDFTSPRVLELRGARPLELVVVPARVEQDDPDLVRSYRERFEAAFAALQPRALKDAEIALFDLLIPYDPACAFEERVLESRMAEPRPILAAFERLVGALALLAAPGSRAASLAGGDGREAPRPQYDVTQRFAAHDVFVLATPAAAEAARGFAAELRAAKGLDVFLAEFPREADAPWRPVLAEAAFHSRVLLLLCGAGAAAEVGARTGLLDLLLDGLRAGKRLLAVPFGGGTLADVPEQLRSLVPDSERDWDGLLQKVESGRGSRPGRARAQIDRGPPYVGLAPLLEEQAAYFAGRAALVRTLAEEAERGGTVAVTGASGVGKTSLVRAGLIPALQQEAAKGGVPRQVELLGPADGDAAALAARVDSGQGARRLIVVDALERVAGDLAPLLAALARVASGPHTAAVVVLRDDGLARVAASEPGRTLLARRIRVLPLRGAELREAIERPAKQAGLAFEPGLAERIAKTVEADDVELGHVQLALLGLYDQRRDGWLTNEAYNALRGLGGLAAAAAEEFFAAPVALNDPARPLAQRLLLTLLHVAAEGPPVRRKVALGDLLFGEASEAETRAVLDLLTSARILRSELGAGGEATFTLSHEALVRDWPRLAGWIEHDRAFLLWRGRFAALLDAWLEAGRRPGLLLEDVGLADAERWLREKGQAWFTRRGREFIENSEAARERTRRRTIAALGAVAAIVLVLAATAAVQWRSASSDRDAALGAQKNAEIALSGLREQTLRLADGQASPDRRWLFLRRPDQTTALIDLATGTSEQLLDGEDKASAALFSPDSKRLTFGTRRGVIEIWRCDAVPPLRLARFETGRAEVSALSLDPAGSVLAAGLDDGSSRVYDVATAAPEERFALHGYHKGAVLQVDLRLEADPPVIQTTGLDGSTVVWDARDGRMLDQFGAVQKK